MVEAFWKAWAAREARQQWLIWYRDRLPPRDPSKVTPRGPPPRTAPPVKQVDILEEPPAFRVTFEDGTVLDLVPTGLASPPRS